MADLELELARVALLDAAERQLVVALRHEPLPESALLLEALGVRWRIDARAPRCVRRCGRKECRVSDALAPIRHVNGMGSFVAPALTSSPAPPTEERKGLTFFVRDERCAGCDWPTVCEQDRTCWNEERAEAARRRARAATAKRATSGPVEEPGSGDGPGTGGGSAPAGAATAPPAAEVGGASQDLLEARRRRRKPYGRDEILAAFKRFHLEHGRWPLPQDVKTCGYLPTSTFRPPTRAATGLENWQAVWDALGAGRVPSGQAAAKYARSSSAGEGVVDQDVTGSAIQSSPGEGAASSSVDAPAATRAPSPAELELPTLAIAGTQAGRALELAELAGVRLTPRIRAALGELFAALAAELLEVPS